MEQGVIDKPECPVQHKDEGISFPTILMASITSSKGIISAYPAILILAEFNALVAAKIFYPDMALQPYRQPDHTPVQLSSA